MATRTQLFPFVGRRLTLASMLALGTVAAMSFAAGGDQHAPPTKPAKPATGAPANAPAAPAKSSPTTPASGKPAANPASENAAPKQEQGAGAGHGANGEKAPAGHGAAAEAPANTAAQTAHENPAPTEAPKSHAAAHADVPSVSADEALRRLVEGNARFAHDIDHMTIRDVKRRGELASGQHPFAIVLSCADSRVPPELVFDQELGDLFVVRVAGNTPDDAIVGSMEYALEHLGSRLIVVMGHTKCGAVKAAVDTAKAGKDASSLSGHLPAIVAQIMPAVAETKDAPGDAVRAAAIRNVQRTVASLRACGPTITEYIASKGTKVIGAIYDLETGTVDLVPELSPATEAAAQTAGASESGHEER